MSILTYTAAIGLSRSGLVHMPSKAALKRTAVGVALLAGLGGAADFGYGYWTVGQDEVSTDNAYVQADYTTVAPKISGYVGEVLVQDNQKVTAGQVLARIDDRDFKVALDQATADVKTAEAALDNIDAQLNQQQSVIDQEKADIAQGEASLSYAKADNVRYDQLMKTGYGTVQRAQQTSTVMRERTAQLSRSRAGLIVAQCKIDVLTTERVRAEAQRDHARAVQHQAE